MSELASLPARESLRGGLALASAIAACQRSTKPSRALDGLIALAVFPGLGELPIVAEGIWAQGDGARVRALCYSASRTAAASLVPAGCWLESCEGGSIVCGDHDEWAGAHEIEAIALCIAALSARIAEACHGV